MKELYNAKTINTAIIGVGNMGYSHLNTILRGEIIGTRVTAVCDIADEKLERVKKLSAGIELYKSCDEMLKLADADAVIIAVPHPEHSRIAIKAFEHGKHVLLEKPADITVSAAKRLNAVAEKSGKTFGIMFNQRTNELYQKARDIVKSGGLGNLKRSIWIITNWYRTQSYYNSGLWRATWSGEGGGVLLNQAPHNLDIWQWICGMPISVTAFCNVGKFHNVEIEDEAAIYTEYANGATGVFITSTGDLPGTNRLEISGTLGKIVLENGKLKHWKLKCDERDICRCAAEGYVNPDFDYEELTAPMESGHKGILQNFTNSVLHGKKLIAPGYDGINELAISNAAYLSEWKGNKKISVPFNTAEFDEFLAKKIEASHQKEVSCGKEMDNSCENRWRVKW